MDKWTIHFISGKPFQKGQIWMILPIKKPNGNQDKFFLPSSWRAWGWAHRNAVVTSLVVERKVKGETKRMYEQTQPWMGRLFFTTLTHTLFLSLSLALAETHTHTFVHSRLAHALSLYHTHTRVIFFPYIPRLVLLRKRSWFSSSNDSSSEKNLQFLSLDLNRNIISPLLRIRDWKMIKKVDNLLSASRPCHAHVDQHLIFANNS